MLAYPSPIFWSQAWWVPLLFAGATITVVRGAALFGRPGEGPPAARVLASDLLSFCLAYALTSFTHDVPNVTLAMLVLWWIARVLRGESRSVILYSLTLALLGTLFEVMLSSTGAFYYQHPDFLGVPRWLPGIYLHAAPLALRIARRMA